MLSVRGWVLGALGIALLPVSALAQIYEYSDEDGKVVRYKYSHRGSVGFSDNLAAIPQEVLRRQKIVKVRVPGTRKTETAPPPEAPAVPAPPQAPSFVVDLPQPPAPPAEAPGRAWTGAVLAAVGAVALLVFAAVLKQVIGRRERSAARPAAPRPAAAGPRPAREAPRAGDERKAPPEGAPSRERQEGLVNRYVEEGDFAAAARLCESFEDLPRAAACHRKAGNLARARELYVSLKDHRAAAEVSEELGEELRAAELYEAAAARAAAGAEGPGGDDSALRGGRLFERAGDEARALGVYAQAGLFAEAAPLYEKLGDFGRAGDAFLKAGDAERAAACFGKSADPARGSALLADFLYEKGMVGEAAIQAEAAGDFVRAAEMHQEQGSHAKAGALFARAGFFAEAAESFALANDQAGAAAAFEQAGRHLQAAQALEAAGGEPARVAGLFEKGGEFHAAGRFYIKAGDLSRALHALQQVDPSSANGASASLLTGMIFLRTGKVGLAQEKFLKIIDNRPIDRATLDAYYFLALCHESSGDAAKAKAIFEKILVEDYAFRDVRRRLDKMGAGA